MQLVEEVQVLMASFPDRLLWKRPAGLASAGFHLLHLAGVLHRLCTYARGSALSAEQREYLQQESDPQNRTVAELVAAVEAAVHYTLKQLKETPEESLGEHRGVGQKSLPSTVGGLLAHAAEHSMRHLGQLLVTVRILVAEDGLSAP